MIACRPFLGKLFSPVCDTAKIRAHKRIVRTTLYLEPDAKLPTLDHSVPLAFDQLGAPSTRTTTVLEILARETERRTLCTIGAAKSHHFQRRSFTMWSTVTSATLAPMAPSWTGHFPISRKLSIHRV